MPKILLVANTDWYLYNFRISLAEYLRSQGMEVIFVCPGGKFIQRVQAKGFQWIQWNVRRKTISPFREFISFINLCRIYQKEKPDVIHHHTIKSVLYGSLAARLARIHGVINSITGLGYIFSSSDLLALLIRPFVKVFYRWVLNQQDTQVIFENKTDQEFFVNQKLTSKEQTILIPGVGVDTIKFSPEPEPPQPIVILMPSRMLWDKGVGIFVEAVRILRKRQAFRAALVGEPDAGNPSSIESKVLDNWQNEGIVEWWGWQEDMPSIYSQGHIVAFPTMYGEGVPTILLEAFACGRPVVTTNVPGCRDVVIDGLNGFLVAPRDSEALANALEKLLVDSSLRSKMGNAGRRLALEKFSLNENIQQTLAVYHRVIEKDTL